jgi:hypothetical protein
MEVCILISTCNRYSKLASLTVELINKHWKNHPPVFVCGLDDQYLNGAYVLPLMVDGKDWVGIVRSATDHLIGLGYKKCYLILEDHIPLGTCNEIHLNTTLPALMNELGAAYIGLHGWDQNTTSDGIRLGRRYRYLQHQSDNFLWRYALHPALWDTRALAGISSVLMDPGDDLSLRSAWAFERRAGTLQTNEWGPSYRVCGLGMLGGRDRLPRSVNRHIKFLLLNTLLWVIKILFGKTVQSKAVNFFMHELLFFDGPYPMYWSGVMQKGKLNKNLEKYLLVHRRRGDLSLIKDALQ